MAAVGVSTQTTSDLSLFLQVVQSKTRTYKVEVDAQHKECDFPKNDFFTLPIDFKKKILEKLNDLYVQIEQSEEPGAGYKVKFVGSNTGRNPFEASLKVYDSREPNTPMKMPDQKSCIFCDQIESNRQHPRFQTHLESSVRVIQSLQDNPLIISKEHREHWFKTSLEEQVDMLFTAEKVLNTFKNASKRNYELHIHVGKEGHQKIPHAHIHTLAGLNVPLAYV